MQYKVRYVCGFALALCVACAGCSESKPRPISLPAKGITQVFVVCEGREREVSDPRLRERLLDAIRGARPTGRKGVSLMREWISVRDRTERNDLVVKRIGPAAEVYWNDSWYESWELYDILENEVDNLPSRKFTPP